MTDDVRVGRQPLDRGRDAGALAPALEAELRLRREQPRQRPRRGADRARQRLRSHGRLVGSASTMSAARRQRGSCGSGMKVAESSAWCSSSITSLISSSVRSRVAAVVEQREDRLMQQRRHPHHELVVEAVRCAPRARARSARNRACASRCRPARRSRAPSRAGTQTARSGGTSQRPFGVVTCMVPLGGIDQLRLAVHVGVEPDALPIAVARPCGCRRRSTRAASGRGRQIGVSTIFIGDIPSGHAPYNLFSAENCGIQ